MTNQLHELIDFLDGHWCSTHTAGAARDASGNLTEHALRKLQNLREEFLSELRGKTTEELGGLVFEVLQEQDKSRPFNNVGTDADYEHFGRCAYLKPDEAAALSLGKDPRHVGWSMVSDYFGASPFAFNYASRLDLIERAVQWGELSNRFTPVEFYHWTCQYQVPVPDDFVQLALIRGEPIEYWHYRCEALTTKLEEVHLELEAQRAENARLLKEVADHEQIRFDDWLVSFDAASQQSERHQAELGAVQEQLEQAKAENTGLRNKLNQTQTCEEPERLTTTERKSLLIIAIASAVDGLGYDPTAKKSPTAKDIADAAHGLGLKISDDTVRKYLQEAAKLNGFTPPERER